MKRLVWRERFLLDRMRLFASKLVRMASCSTEVRRVLVCQTHLRGPSGLRAFVWKSFLQSLCLQLTQQDNF